jgi:FtsH-binding integral membrane protein
MTFIYRTFDKKRDMRDGRNLYIVGGAGLLLDIPLIANLILNHAQSSNSNLLYCAEIVVVSALATAAIHSGYVLRKEAKEAPYECEIDVIKLNEKGEIPACARR